jgi:ABC-type bacteriocin/lantibiotic exporter with double-glycine peptidase domain
MPKGSPTVPHKRQEHPWTCLPACVRMVLSHFGDERDEADVAQQLRCTSSGTLFNEIVSLGEWGYDVRIEQGTLSRLVAVIGEGVPVVVSVHTSHLPYCPLPPWGAHAVVIVGASRTGFTINDPDQPTGGTRISRVAFENAWAMRQRRLATIRPGG